MVKSQDHLPSFLGIPVVFSYHRGEDGEGASRGQSAVLHRDVRDSNYNLCLLPRAEYHIQTFDCQEGTEVACPVKPIGIPMHSDLRRLLCSACSKYPAAHPTVTHTTFHDASAFSCSSPGADEDLSTRCDVGQMRHHSLAHIQCLIRFSASSSLYFLPL